MKKKSKSISELTKEIESIYDKDPTLKELKRLEEDRKSLSSIDIASKALSDSLIESQVTDLYKTVSSPALQHAFKTVEDYEKYTKPILSSIESKDYLNLQESIKKATEPYLASDYLQTIRATDLFNDTIKNAANMNILKDSQLYQTQLSEAINLFNDHDKRLTASKDLLGLASIVENEAFKAKITPIGEFAKKMASPIKDFDTIGKTINPMFESHTKINKLFDTNLNKIDLPKFEIPKIEDSPMYKQNEKLINRSDKQIDLLENMASYMSSQTKNLELQNEITADQIEKTEISSKSAMRVAMWSIVLSIIFSIVSIGVTYYVYIKEDKSDNIANSELQELIKANNTNKVLSELVEGFKEQNLILKKTLEKKEIIESTTIEEQK
jgi:cbb3-type cytochrome oxidase subunit 3